MSTDPAAIEIASLMPHTGSRVWLDGVRSHDDSATVTHLRADPERHGRDAEGHVPSWVAVELMAQSISAHEALLALDADESPSPGLLVSISKLELSVPAFHEGEELEVSTRRLRGRPELGVLAHHCEVTRSGSAGDREHRDVLARGRLTVWISRS